MKTKKSTAFWAGLIWFSLFSVFCALNGALAALGTPIILGVVGVLGIYTGGSVADNFQRSKYFRPELNEGQR